VPDAANDSRLESADSGGAKNALGERAATVAEALKDLAYEHDLERAEASFRTAADSWLVIAIRAPSVLEDSHDGWVVEEKEVSL
jgi:hypothetical protein